MFYFCQSTTMFQGDRTLAQLLENLSLEEQVICSKAEFERRIKATNNYYGSDDDDDDDDDDELSRSPDYICCAKHNRSCQDAINRYDMLELLKTAEAWYKDLHRLELPEETFIKLFVESLPDDVYVFMEEVNMDRFNSCSNCDNESDYSNSYSFYKSIGLYSLAECFCTSCGEGLLYWTEQKTGKYVPPDCTCTGDIVFLKASNQIYCKVCRREFVDVHSSDTEADEDSHSSDSPSRKSTEKTGASTGYSSDSPSRKSTEKTGALTGYCCVL
ncbi:iap-like protein [Heliothis virescens ascovirus 3j]|uniref:Iap-like protein n=1 Tax=Heliothis virescens ascovirus 3j TaxID=1561067 RepID=A0A2Z5UZH6_9VIRU|nr:iap-like protein [Heliothis virescens ascovirus 3j]